MEVWLAGSSHYSCFVVDAGGNVLYLLSRGESEAPGKNVIDILSWHDAMVYLAAVRECLREDRPTITTYHFRGERYVCAIVPMDAGKVYSHRLTVCGSYNEALQLLIRLVFSDQLGFNRRK